ncbi:allantoate amidohydrolase [Paeniglutamicibacter sp. Y32M11]|uniref:allantoate amidohydrolase n=1 Tax=Paeniglutamicibacter sp. Y32M11 TaxID=2853258 RepID=UPI001C531B17|nr:allantoate amidohydrolase [Paeniglutamicibacter sp. Y32M11]QXQ10052.1 allantoate amidohydrolase [Paeniglutamicibacter sp. Y32M11]
MQQSNTTTLSTVTGLMGQISETGRDALRGGYTRPVYSHAEIELRDWFIEQAQSRGLSVEQDGNGALWAWWDLPTGDRTDAVVTGSHLDSVPGGGPFDGPLGVASALVALDLLKSRVQERTKALAIVVFPEEEGSRFGVACLGTRLMTGAITLEKALNLRDQDGTTFADVARANGLDTRLMGPDPTRLAHIGAFVELHVEQGLGLGELDHPVAIGGSILGHGRWRLSITGQGNHAGTTLMAGRRDPMVAAAQMVVTIRNIARDQPHARATVGRIEPVPGGTNVIASAVNFWLDVRHPDDAITAALIQRIHDTALDLAASEGCELSLNQESLSPTVTFDASLTARLQGSLMHAPVLDTGAGHDAGVLAAHVPSAMIFVRNPSGISHSPEEYVEDADAEVGAAALADALAGMLN